MFKTFNEDRKFIESKYHLPGKPFNSCYRWESHGYDYDESTGLSDEQIQEGLKELNEKVQGESHPVQKAKLFEYVLDNNRIDINEHDYFIGMWTWNRPIYQYTVAKWGAENRQRFPEQSKLMGIYARAGMAHGGLDYDHTVPDWDSLLSLGFKGVLDRLKESYKKLSENGHPTKKQTEFYKGAVIEYEAIIRFINRLYKNALTQKHEKAQRCAECLKHLSDGAPTDSYEAMQLIFMYFMLSESIENYQVRSLGFGLDNSLYPFYKSDIESGRYTKDELAEFLAYFLMQWSAIGNYWGQPFYLGGRDVKGSSKVNELSYLILEVYDKLGLYNPKIQIKISKNTPKDFVYQALKMIQGGNTSIVLCNDEMITKCLMSYGATYEQAIESVISGCYEYKTKNRDIGISGFYVNAVKPVSFVFDNGFDTIINEQMGLKTGELDKINNFDDFYQAYLAQLENITLNFIYALKEVETGIEGINPSLMFSSTIENCAKTMTDALDNGIINNTGVLLSGLGTAVDALMAVYELVYENKATTLCELKQALANDWEGYEHLKRKALNCKHKYGRGDELADYYAGAIVRFFYNLFAGLKNGHNCQYGLELHSAKAFIIHGEKTKATPDGRKFGEEVSKNASPHPGADKDGITALIHSATAIDTCLANNGFCLDVMLHPTTVQGQSGLDVLYQVMRTYMDKGGHSIHFNIFNADLLRDAQAHPEKYENLQVRVCGWNVLWNNMPKSEQDVYILRSGNISE